MLYLVTMSLLIIVLFQFLIPTFIIPLFYTLTDLQEGKLKDAILAEAKKTDVTVSQIKVMDGSTRSSHSNAFVTGLYPYRKVVIFDTLID